MFHKALQFKNVIIICYRKQNTVKINGIVPHLFIWHIYQIIVDCIFPIMNASVLNQFDNH
jgi:hypothetical protein